MRQDAVPQRGLGTRDDLMGLRQLLNVGSSGHQWIVEELNSTDLQHVRDDLRVLGIALVPTVVQRFSRSHQVEG